MLSRLRRASVQQRRVDMETRAVVGGVVSALYIGPTGAHSRASIILSAASCVGLSVSVVSVSARHRSHQSHNVCAVWSCVSVCVLCRPGQHFLQRKSQRASLLGRGENIDLHLLCARIHILTRAYRGLVHSRVEHSLRPKYGKLL